MAITDVYVLLAVFSQTIAVVWSTAVYIFVLCQSLNVSQHSLWNCCIQSETSASRLFLAKCFCVLRSLSNFLFVNEVFSSLLWSSCDSFRFVARDTGVLVDTTQQVARVQTASPTLMLSATWLSGCGPPTKLCLAGAAVVWARAEHDSHAYWKACSLTVGEWFNCQSPARWIQYLLHINSFCAVNV